MHIVAVLVNAITKYLLALFSDKINVVQDNNFFLVFHVGTGLAKGLHVCAIIIDALFL
jgi:hypothetical protein